MFNGFRSEAFLDNFNAPANAGITATGGTISVFPANPRTNYIKNPLSNTANIIVYGSYTPVTVADNQYAIMVTSQANSGQSYATIVFNLNVQQMQTGSTYTFSCMQDMPLVPYTVIQYYDAFGNPVYGNIYQSNVSMSYVETNSQGGQTATTISQTTSTSGYQKMSGNFTYSGAPAAVVRITYMYRNNQTTAYYGYTKHPIVELGSSTGDYFSGATADCHWNGAPHNSTSSQNQYKVHTFTSNGNFDITGLGSTYNSVEYLIVAGGGAGGNYNGGGGGAGGMLTNVGGTPLQVSLGSYPVVVGSGGAGTAYPNPGGNGGNSSVLGLTAIGGGGGGAPWGNGTNNEAGGRAGGSGGGAGYNTNYIASGGAGTAGQGNKGGDGAI